MANIGILGGTGLYSIDSLDNVEELSIETPFGPPSSPVTRCALSESVDVYFIARHGPGHRLSPSAVPYRANIYALKTLGVNWCISVSAVGSLQEHIHPGDVVIPDQFIDRTKHRRSTFFEDGIVAHIPFANPICPTLSRHLGLHAAEILRADERQLHQGGTYLCMEGPQFSTRAESNMYRQFGATIIGMTNLTEAKLAREAQISYSSLSMVTDYDCWRSTEADVSVEDIIARLHDNTALAKQILSAALPGISTLEQPAVVANALEHAIITNPAEISDEVKERLAPIMRTKKN